MKLIKGLWLTLLTFTAGAAPAADVLTPRTDINPALLYYQSFILAPQLDTTNNQFLFGKEWSGQKLPDKFGELMRNYDNQFAQLRRAAHCTVPCDWQLDFSSGPYTLLPHLGRMKSAAQAAQLRVLWDLQHDQPTEARDDLNAAFVMARNVSRDGTIIGVLVQIACEAIVFNSVAGNFGRFPPETLQQLVDGFDAAPAFGTVTMALRGEKSGYRDWMIFKIQQWQRENPGKDGKVMESFHKFLDEQMSYSDTKTNPWPRISAAAGGTSEGLLRLLHDTDAYYDRLITITALPLSEYENQMKQISADIQKSTNPFVSWLVPPLEKASQREFRIQAVQAMVRAAVEYKLHGMDGFKTVKDPCGNGPFTFERFVFKGTDRGFKLTSAYTGMGYPLAQIFVEKEGPAFYLDGGTNRIGHVIKND